MLRSGYIIRVLVTLLYTMLVIRVMYEIPVLYSLSVTIEEKIGRLIFFPHFLKCISFKKLCIQLFIICLQFLIFKIKIPV